MSQRVPAALVHSIALALACAASYLLTTRAQPRAPDLPARCAHRGDVGDDRHRIRVQAELRPEPGSGPLSSVGNPSQLRSLLRLPAVPSFSVWGMALLIGVGALVLLLIGHADDVITATATTSVVMVLAAISPHDAWEQPVLRLADTAVGIAMGDRSFVDRPAANQGRAFA